MKIGRITLAATLIGAGAGILADNLLGIGLTWYVVRLWPALLILLGLEWVWASTRQQDEGRRISVDGGAIAGLVIVALIASSVSSWNRFPTRSSPFDGDFTVEVRPFTLGTVSADAVMTQDLNLAIMQELVISSSAASITVQEGPVARVELRTRAWGRNAAEAEQYANQSQLRVETGSRTTIRAIFPNSNTRVEHSFLVTLPKAANLALRATTSSGSLRITDRTGDVYAETSSGSLRIDRVKGNVDARSSSGSFQATDIDGSLAVTASSGSITAEAVTGDVKANGNSGSVTVRAAGGKISAQASSGSVTVESGQVGGDYDLQSNSGSVRLLVPADAGVTVNARANSGTVSGPSWLTIGEGRNSGSGTQGDGSRRVDIRTSSGSIRIETR